MSRFHGPQGKGAMKRHRDERYYRAVGRQQLLCDKGVYHRPETALGFNWPCTPVRAEELMRVEHRDPNRHGDYDFRSFAREARRS